MEELVKVKEQFVGSNYVQTVNAREFYNGLGFDSSNWKRWSEKNIVNNEFFKQDVDFIELFIVTSSPNPPKEFAISIEMAKHLCMMARTEKAHDYRNYFIECENQLKNYKKEINTNYIHRQIAREEAYPMLDAYDDCAEENGREIGRFDHSTEFDMLNSIVLGLTAQGYKFENSIPLHESSIRDYLSPLQLEAIAFLQNANTLMLNEGEIDRPVRKERLQKLFDKKFATRFEREVLRLQF